ncbi:S-adenosyl-L-methionine-dependent methyltransferase [Calycina marina]|uniref:tRNA (guanine(10)-N(2))-methyltransferase n=1 Tax=Calycina marina TaxID=1763456 RepID=A0A9P7ZAR2_9HELO|nr:S-adenosyl-L-methionine-dependent methyltransferase [Calycina marina]
MVYMIRFTQVHETFRLAETKALAVLEGIDLEIISYSPTSPFCMVKLPSEEAAKKLLQRSILAKAIYEVWGHGSSYPELHESTKATSSHLWPLYKNVTFKFVIDSFQGSRTNDEQRALIDSFRFLEFEGPIHMKGAQYEFCLAEDWPLGSASLGIKKPTKVFLGRYLARSERDVISKYDLKKRKYISTTSMDSELALVTANITLAAPGKLFYDPFVGTGSFPIACAHFGALAFGSDIDGRSIRGKGKVSLLANFEQYGLTREFGDSFVADLTNSPVRRARLFDGILCDPPYGVREGLKVLGHRDPTRGKTPIFRDGLAHHLDPKFVPPKKPYSFLAMLDDILEFATTSLVDNGRLSFWMPTANDVDQEIKIPEHPSLEIIGVCTQEFNQWSRRLITYRRIPDAEVVASESRQPRVKETGVNANDLNPFRKGYFQGFKPVSKS